MGSTYYKLVSENEILDILEKLEYVTYSSKYKSVAICESRNAMGIFSSNHNKIWDISYMKDFPEEAYESLDIETAELVSINEDEYSVLKKAFESEETVKEEVPEDGIIDYVDPLETSEIELVKQSKIAEMRNACNKKIIEGFTVELSDGNVYKFDLTVEDQLNIMSLKEMISEGVTEIPYHASGEICKFYSVEDINRIIQAASNLKTYCVTYYNSLKSYIQSLTDIYEIDKIEFGTTIPDEYQSEVLVALSKLDIE